MSFADIGLHPLCFHCLSSPTQKHGVSHMLSISVWVQLIKYQLWNTFTLQACHWCLTTVPKFEAGRHQRRTNRHSWFRHRRLWESREICCSMKTLWHRQVATSCWKLFSYGKPEIILGIEHLLLPGALQFWLCNEDYSSSGRRFSFIHLLPLYLISDTRPHTLAFTEMGNLEAPVNLVNLTRYIYGLSEEAKVAWGTIAGQIQNMQTPHTKGIKSRTF